MKDRETIKAIHDNDIKKLIYSLGLEQRLSKGELKCKFCKDVVRLETINAIFPQAGDIKISCSKPECIIALASFLNDR